MKNSISVSWPGGVVKQQPIIVKIAEGPIILYILPALPRQMLCKDPTMCAVYLPTVEIVFWWRHLLRHDVLHSRSENASAISTMEDRG